MPSSAEASDDFEVEKSHRRQQNFNLDMKRHQTGRIWVTGSDEFLILQNLHFTGYHRVHHVVASPNLFC